MSGKPDPGEFAAIARIRRAWGRRGEVFADLFTDFPERLRETRQVILARAGGSEPGDADLRTAELEAFRPHKSGVVLKFGGVDSISAAELLAGCEVRIPASERRALEGPAVYWDRLAGCRVLEHGIEIGVVRHLDPTVGTPVLVVDTPQGELLVPFAEEICRRIDAAEKVIEVELPEGLRDLNR